MIRRYALPALAVAGIAAAAIVVLSGSRGGALPPAQATAQTPAVPFTSYIAGTGVVEAHGGNVAVGTPVPGIVTGVYVTWNDSVEAGDSLFKIDDRDLEAQLNTARTAISEAESNVERARYLLQAGEALGGDFLSEEEVERRRYDVTLGEAALATRRAEARQIEVEIERHTVQAPIAGRILQIFIRVGEYAQGGGAPETPLLVLGDDTRLDVRTEIDEYDAWRLRPGSAAQVFVRGNPSLNAPLRFERIEPLVAAKTAFTGASTERTDARVLPVVFSLDRSALPVFVGQEVDVYVEAPPVDGN